MYPSGLLSWRIAFVLYLFFHLADSAAVVRKPALANIVDTSTGGIIQPFKPLAGGATDAITAPFVRAALNTQSLSASVTVITTRTAVPTTINGIPTFTDVLTTVTSRTLVPIPTTTSQAVPNDDTPSHSSNSTFIPLFVSLGAIAVLSLILFIIMRRRRALRTRTQISPLQIPDSPKEIRSHFGSKSDAHRASWAPDINTDGELPRSSVISTRQLVISNQVNRAREKVAELEEISSLLRSSSNSSHEDRTRQASVLDVLPPAAAVEDSVNNPSNVDSLGVQDKLERAIRQIEGLNNRIHELEGQRRSSWALGRSDEPPPGYTEDPE
ncbi:hypothetical protein B0H13DRAFT_837101 [Mycena leptocephala]|nr:hypothetical protein B0H13DRAFT_837101 [Mycena leptocephala]